MRGSDEILTVVLEGQGHAGAQRGLSPHDPVPAVKVFRVHVHGSALAAGTAGIAASQLREDPNGIHAHHVSPAVGSIGRYDRVVVPHRGFHSHAAGLLHETKRDSLSFIQGGIHPWIDTDLAGVEVAKAPDDLLLVQVARCRLHPADHLHVLVVLEGILPRNSDRGGWALLQLVQLERLFDKKIVR